MKEEEYNKLCQAWDDFIAKKTEYYNKRVTMIKEGCSEEELDKLDKEYSQTSEDCFSGASSYWGPETIITDLQDLCNPDFKLPGRNGKSFLDLNRYPEIIEHFGEIYDTEDYGKCKIIGFMYDCGDDYILLEELETGKKRGVFKIKKKEVD